MRYCRIIGITGGIGAGKSVVSRLIRGLGYPVYDCDIEARRIMNDSDELKEEICNRMGADCMLADGSLCRPRIAEIVFNNETHRSWLNNRVHSLVRQDVISKAETCGDKTLFVESAILKTGALSPLCDEIWVVTAPDEIRIERACIRDKASPADIKARMRAQKTEFEDFGDIPTKIIDNSGTRPLLPQVRQIIK